jgi:hypothetical protein
VFSILLLLWMIILKKPGFTLLKKKSYLYEIGDGGEAYGNAHQGIEIGQW